MTAESLRAAMGRRVVSKADAEQLGSVDHVVLDSRRRRIEAIVVGSGKKAQIVEWSGIAGFGPDAVMVEGGAARAPAGEHEPRAAEGAFDLIGGRTLTDRGNELGRLDDVTFDPSTGELIEIRIGERSLPASALLGAGSYAVVVTVDAA